MACFALAKQDSASERWHAEGLAFATADGSRGSLGASDFNRAPRGKKRARFAAFGCRSEEDDFVFFKIFLRSQRSCRIEVVVGNVF